MGKTNCIVNKSQSAFRTKQRDFTFITGYTILQVNKLYRTWIETWLKSNSEYIGIRNEFEMKPDKNSDFYVC